MLARTKEVGDDFEVQRYSREIGSRKPRKPKEAEEVIENKETGYVKWLFELTNKDVAIAGGKGASLAEMYNNKFKVPPAFIVTAQAFKKFISGINSEIEDVISKTNVEDTVQLNQSSKKIREIIEKQEFPQDMEGEILEAYESLGVEKDQVGASRSALDILNSSKEPVFVAVRSSATTEDLAEASFAGQQESFLGVKGNTKLLLSIKKCFSSLYTPRAIYYREKKGFHNVKALLAVVVQRMINSEKSGVMFTKNPVEDDKSILIEAVFGLGEGIVSGKIQPDDYKVNEKIEILSKKIGDKKIALVRSESGDTETIKLPEEKSHQQVLKDHEIQILADIGQAIEQHYKKPQDIEFAVEGTNIYIVQSRPITTTAKGKTAELSGKVLLTGLGASPGVGTGKVKIVRSMDDLEKVQKGDILVTEMTNPDMVVSMQKADGIITDEGGATSHAAIVSREMGIPCVVGTKIATKILKDGQIVTVDGRPGKVYEGAVGEEKKEDILPVVETKTKIKVIVDLPEFAERAAKSGCDSIGLLRLEGIIAMSGKHPIKFISEGKSGEYKELIQKGVQEIAEHFKNIWVRSSDIRSDEFRNLEGSPREMELNPMLGDHGIRFSLKNREVLRAELQAIKAVAEKYPDKKIGIMFPQIISVDETKEAKKEFDKIKTKNMEMGIMVETPAACMIIDSLVEEGIDFISFGTNDLTQYTLAVDRGNENVQNIYNEMHPAVLSQIVKVIKACRPKNIETSLCGQAGSKPDMAAFLIKNHIDSISVNADAAYDISKLIQQLEKTTEEIPESNKKEEIKEVKELKEEKKDVPEIEKKEDKVKEFPDTDIGFDVFNPSMKIAGCPPNEEEHKEDEAVPGSFIKTTKEKQEFPDIEINTSFLDFPSFPGPTLPPQPMPNPHPRQGNDEEDEEIQDVIDELNGKRDEEDIDIPEEPKDDTVLDIF